MRMPVSRLCRLRWLHSFLSVFSAVAVLFLSSCEMPETARVAQPALHPPALQVREFGGPDPLFASMVKDERDGARDMPSSPLVISIREAALLALQRNPAFLLERLETNRIRTFEAEERSVFDPVLAAEVSILRENDDGVTDSAGIRTDRAKNNRTRTAELSVEQYFPTGTTIELSARRTLETARDDSSDSSGADDRDVATACDLTITQALLKGGGPTVNLARLWQARLDTRISRHIVEAAAETLIFQIESTGWDYLLARQQIAIYEESLKIAIEQLDEVRERIQVGVLADIELAAVEAEVAKRREDLINAKSLQGKTRLEFFRLLADADTSQWDRELVLTDTPEVPADTLAPTEQHVALALRQRADLNEAQLRIERGELELVRTRNGLLPRLDFFITLGNSRYARAFSTTNKDEDGDLRNIEAGIQLEYTLGHRNERAVHSRSLISLQQAREALRNLENLAQVDVRTAYLEVQRTAEQIEATRATRKHREAALHSETEKFRVGKSTGLLVAQTQRDLVASRITEIEAVVEHLKARLNLYFQEGSLLERRGVTIPAQE